MDRPRFAYPVICWWTFGLLSVFQLLWMMLLQNIDVQIPLWDPASNSSECMPRSGITGSYSDSILNFLRQLLCFAQWLYHVAFPPGVYRLGLFPDHLFQRSSLTFLEQSRSLSAVFTLPFQGSSNFALALGLAEGKKKKKTPTTTPLSLPWASRLLEDSTFPL